VSKETCSGCQLSKARVWARELRPNRAGSEGGAGGAGGAGRARQDFNPASGCGALGRLTALGGLRDPPSGSKDLQLLYGA
jgi:hypothetical protein